MLEFQSPAFAAMKEFRCVALRMSRIDDMLSARDAKLDDPALKDAESDEDEGNKRSCLDIVHRNPAEPGRAGRFVTADIR